MKIKELGEQGLINRLATRFGADLPAGVTGIGDDCAVFAGPGDELELVTTDLLVQQTHFHHDAIAPGDLGHKALAVNLSDIAAMGGTPHSAYLSLALPGDLEATWFDRFLDGVQALASDTGTLLLGGDTTRSPGPVVINLAVIGRVAPDRIKYRHGAGTGDVLCVTGTLGDSAAGLRLQAEPRLDNDPDGVHLLARHHRPRPHLQEGRWLSGQAAVHAMMDLSDGLAQDLARMAAASAAGARVELAHLPLSTPLQRAGGQRGWDPEPLAASGGEDYCLLAAVAPEAFPKVQRGFESEFGADLHRVGEVLPAAQGVSYWSGVKRVELGGEGFRHF